MKGVVEGNVRTETVKCIVSLVLIGAGLVVRAEEGVSTSSWFPVPTNGFSAAVWARPDVRLRSTHEEQNLVMAGDGWFSGFALRLRGRPDGAARAYFELVGAAKEKFRACAEDIPLAAGRCVHLACTWDTAVLRLYVNGSLAATVPANRGYLYSRNGKKLVRFVCGDDDGAGATVADGRFWQRVLTPREVANLAAGAPALKDAAPFAEQLERAFRMRCVGAAELLRMAEEAHVSPATRKRVEEALPMAYLVDGDVKSALRAFAALPAKTRTPDVEIALADKMIETGFAEAALDVYRKQADSSAGKPWEAVARQALAAACRRCSKECLDVTHPGLGAYCRATAQGGACVSSADPERRIFVAPNGDDENGDGSEARPFATARKARDVVREVKSRSGLPTGGVAVVFRGGTYRISETLDLNDIDSGTWDSPIVWRAAENERVVWTGALAVPGLDCPDADDPVLRRIPAAARSRVRVADVRALPHAADPLPDFEAGHSNPPPSTDLFADGRRLTPARFPNEGWLQITNLLSETRTDGRQRVSTLGDFQSDLEDVSLWEDEPDLRATGYWFVYWSDATRRVTVNPKSAALRLDGKTAVRKGGVFYLSNAARALDADGEWFLDSTSGRLYVLPPSGGAESYSLSSFDRPFLRAQGCRFFRIEGFVFEQGRGTAIELTQCEDAVFAGNVISGFGGNGLVVGHVRRMTVSENILHDFGHAAVVCSGGDRRRLEVSGIRILDNDISRPEHRARTYAPALQIEGCGVEISNNHLHHVPSSAIRLEGNDHFIVSNLVEDVVFESDDQGALDVYFDTSYAGNLYGWNVWRRCGTRPKGFPDFCGRCAIRFDDSISSQTVHGNWFEDCAMGGFGAVQMNGGRFNTVDNNLFVNCPLGVSIHSVPLATWTNTTVRKVEKLMFGEKGIDVRREPYAGHYPYLTWLMASDQTNILTRNVSVGPMPLVSRTPAATEAHFNRAFAEMPDLSELTCKMGIASIPKAKDVGPRPTLRFLRAKRNDRPVR